MGRLATGSARRRDLVSAQRGTLARRGTPAHRVRDRDQRGIGGEGCDQRGLASQARQVASSLPAVTASP